MGFETAHQKFKIGDPAREYADLVMATQPSIVDVLATSLQLETIECELLSLKTDIDTLNYECKVAFVKTGEIYDYNERLKEIKEIETALTNDIIRTKDAIAAEVELSQAFRATINKHFADVAAGAMIDVDDFRRSMTEKEKIDQDRENKRKELEEKRKKEAEAQKRLEELENEQETETEDNEADPVFAE